MKPLKIAILLCCIFMLSGCWDRREPELRALALAGGVDINEEGMYQVSIQYATPKGITSDGEGHEGKAFSSDSARGYSPFEAARNLSLGISRELMWSHSRLFVFSERLAKEKGIISVIDFFERDPEVRLLGLPLLIEGTKEDIDRLFKMEPPLELTTSRAIERRIKTAFWDRSSFPNITSLRDMIISLEKQGEEVIIGRISIPQKKEEESNDKEGEESDDNLSLKIGGAGAFRGDKMVGWLSEQHVSGFNFVKGQTNRGVIVVDSPWEEDEKITFEIFKTRAKLKPTTEEDINFYLRLEIQGRIAGLTGTKAHFTEESKELEKLRSRIAQVVHNDIEAALSRAQELESDFLGLGNVLYRYNPKKWHEVKDHWYDIFPTVCLKADIRVQIRMMGLISNPL